ncbi:hypothetical protein BSR28_06435 [Boudabousia liubingyangii]|uniref:biotin transporter BioY n=1 Tax=Boudabousia liubingyangii TaxID=1921764 RepID=UPI00093A5AA6|nr:biotin transporter BioY [Boudabousia liubingyangii]OKL47045.1 hypothetical protein BSR28_06435 [Boudabousia liubingyangii]
MTINKTSQSLKPAVFAEALNLGRLSGVARDVLLVLGGALLVGALAQLSIPIGPVPVTGQTLGVLLVGAALGAKRGATSLATYLVLGLAGVPWFANFTGGPAALLKPSFGFILGFVFVAALVGVGAERGWDRQLPTAFALYFGASVVLYVFGLTYLWAALAYAGKTLSLGTLLQVGLVPFIPGDLLKTAIAAGLSPLAWKLVNRG